MIELSMFCLLFVGSADNKGVDEHVGGDGEYQEGEPTLHACSVEIGAEVSGDR